MSGEAGFIQAGCQEIPLFQKSGQALEWAAQGGGGVTEPRGVQAMFRCCTKGQQWGNIGER